MQSYQLKAVKISSLQQSSKLRKDLGFFLNPAANFSNL
jgi:hypothetical protein